MPLIIGVVFRKNGNVHYYDPGEIELEIGDKAICHVDKAIEMSEVVTSPTEVSENDMGATLSKIIRKATYYDLSVEELNRSKEEEGVKKFEELTKQHKLFHVLMQQQMQLRKSGQMQQELQ